MQRQRKFRAWDTHRNQYVDDGEIVFSFYGETTTTVVPNSQGYMFDDVHNGEPQRNRFIIEDWIGIQDKNGKDIYEGDIIRRINVWGRDLPIEINGIVRIGEYVSRGNSYLGAYIEDFDGGEISILGFSYLDISIIGNIHQNP